MNRIYKVIWNRVKNCYVVVSEIANNRGKINGRSTTCVGTLLCVLALVGGILSPLNTANAVNPAGTGAGVSWGNGTNSGTDQNNVAIGGYAQALGPVSLALGAHSNSSASYSTAIGGGTQSTAENATAIGGVAKAQGKNATSIGAKAEANGEYATTIGAGAKADKTYAIAIGSLSHATEVSSLAMGNNSKATNTYAYAIGGSAEAKGRWSIAMGTNAVAEDDASVSIGTWSKATTGQSVAVGYLANAKQLGATALGRQTNASAVDATAIGSGSSSTAENGTAIGKSASVSAKNSVAIGTGAKATNENAVALGTGSETAAAVATASESVNGVVHNFAGINPGSTVSVGKTGMERTVTNVAAGRISATSTDAINGSQLYGVANAVGNVANSTKNILGGNAQVDQNGTITMTNIGDTGKNTVHEAIQSVNQGWELQVNGQKVKDVKAPNRTVNFNAGKNIKLEGAGDNVTVATVDNANFNSVTTGSVSMSKTGINAGGYQITNVQSGGDTLTNAANIGDISRIAAKYDKYLQRGSATYEANGNGKINMTGTNGLTAEVTGLKNTYVTSGTVSNDGKRLTLTRNDNQTFDVDISKISNGLSKTDYRLIANPAAGSNGEYKVAADGSMTLTVADADGSNPRQVKLTNLASKEQQDINTTNITNNTNKIAKGLSFQGDNNVKINKQLGDTLGITGGATGALSDNNIGVVAKDGNLNVKLAKDLTGLNSVTAGSVRVGKHSDNKNYVTGLDNKEWNVQNPTITSGRAATEDQLKKVSDEIKTTNAAKTDYRLINNTNSADGSYSVENNKVDLKVKDEAHPNSPANTVTINNIASKTELDKLTERAVKYDLNGTTVNKNKVTLEGQGGTTITNLKAGEVSSTSTDAVNGSQLYSVANDLQTQINNSTPGQINNNIKNLTNRVGTVERRVNKVGAGSAALAALHPLDFNPDDKWTIAAGYGHYHNANSAALGAFYRPNEDTMFSVGGTVGTGETQLNAGVSIRLGKRSPESRSRVAMGREIAELNARLQDMENKYNNLLQILTPHAIDPSKTAEFPDVPRNHWAYQYISQLAGNGILVGYPDGTFKGDVKMTRYEFATMLYRALQNGAPIDENMKRALNEFGPELQNIRLNHFRVDRISGDDNDRHKTERVRVNNEPKNERDVYGSRIYNNQ